MQGRVEEMLSTEQEGTTDDEGLRLALVGDGPKCGAVDRAGRG